MTYPVNEGFKDYFKKNKNKILEASAAAAAAGYLAHKYSNSKKETDDDNLPDSDTIKEALKTASKYGFGIVAIVTFLYLIKKGVMKLKDIHDRKKRMKLMGLDKVSKATKKQKMEAAEVVKNKIQSQKNQSGFKNDLKSAGREAAEDPILLLVDPTFSFFNNPGSSR